MFSGKKNDRNSHYGYEAHITQYIRGNQTENKCLQLTVNETHITDVIHSC